MDNVPQEDLINFDSDDYTTAKSTQDEDLISFDSDKFASAKSEVEASSEMSRSNTNSPSGDVFANLAEMARIRPRKRAQGAPISTPSPKPSMVLASQVRPARPTINVQIAKFKTDPEVFISSAPVTNQHASSSPKFERPQSSIAGSETTLIPILREAPDLNAKVQTLDEMVAQFKALEVTDAEDRGHISISPTASRSVEIENVSPLLHGQGHHHVPRPNLCATSLQLPAVQMTHDVYSSLMSQLFQKTEQREQALAKVETMYEQAQDSNENERDANNELGRLHYQLEAHKDYKAAMGRDLLQKDLQIHKAETQIASLKAKVETTEALQMEIEKLDHEIDFLRSKTTEESDRNAHTVHAQAVGTQAVDEMAPSMEAMKEAYDKEIHELKAAVKMHQSMMSAHAIRGQNLADTLRQREKVNKAMQRKIMEEQNITNGLRDEMEVMQASLPSRDQLLKVEKDLQTKTSKCDRLQHDINTLTKQLERAQEALEKFNGEIRTLKGAAHLVIPASTTHLPKLVFSCMECFLKNIDCDSQSKCENCSRSNEKCARWRCSLRHIVGKCDQAPCRFVHDKNGWLTASAPRPQW